MKMSGDGQKKQALPGYKRKRCKGAKSMSGKVGPSCRIRMLGGMEIAQSGELPDASYRPGMKTYAVLSYLILKRGQAVPIGELARVSGTNSDGKQAVGALKVMIHRIRQRLADEDSKGLGCIISTMMGYAWNMNCGVPVDLFEAEFLCESIMFARRISSLTESEILGLIELCGRELLPEMRGKAWVDFAWRRFRDLHTMAMTHMLGLMWKAGDMERIMSTCRRGMANDSANALLWGYLKRAMEARNGLVEAASIES